MASWAEQLKGEWDREDARRRAGVCPKCGRIDFVTLFVEVVAGRSRAYKRCRCGADFTTTTQS